MFIKSSKMKIVLAICLINFCATEGINWNKLDELTQVLGELENPHTHEQRFDYLKEDVFPDLIDYFLSVGEAQWIDQLNSPVNDQLISQLRQQHTDSADDLEKRINEYLDAPKDNDEPYPNDQIPPPPPSMGTEVDCPGCTIQEFVDHGYCPEERALDEKNCFVSCGFDQDDLYELLLSDACEEERNIEVNVEHDYDF
jgi:hypothetical protein